MSTDWPFDIADQGGPAPATGNVAEYTVSELSMALKHTVEDTYGHVRVRGELGRVSRPGSGHVYLDLKDDRAVISGVIWKGVAAGLSVKPEQGLEVIVTGRLTTYPGQSKYQIVIESMEPAGLGALMALLEERRKKLAAEGLFDEARKQPIPYLPRVIGVVTSPTGAVIRDIMHRLADRFPVRVLVWPVRVQGEKCAAEVAAGIRGFNGFAPGGALPRPDLIIVARGGGSLEDLWGFNEEEVVRAAAESAIPLISAVGHETDWTLIDHAADERCPTPSAAAECAVPVRADLLAMVQDLERRQTRALWRLHEERKRALVAASRGLPRLTDVLALPRQRFDGVAERLPRALRASTQVARGRFSECAVRLSPKRLADVLALPRQRFDGVAERLPRALRASTQAARSRFGERAVRLSPRPLRAQLERHRREAANLSMRIQPAFERLVTQHRRSLSSCSKLLASLSYRSVLARGFALVHGPDGTPVRASAEAKPGLLVEVEFHDGRAPARFEGEGATPRRSTAPKKAKADEGEQGSLL